MRYKHYMHYMRYIFSHANRTEAKKYRTHSFVEYVRYMHYMRYMHYILFLASSGGAHLCSCDLQIPANTLDRIAMFGCQVIDGSAFIVFVSQ